MAARAAPRCTARTGGYNRHLSALAMGAGPAPTNAQPAPSRRCTSPHAPAIWRHAPAPVRSPAVSTAVAGHQRQTGCPACRRQECVALSEASLREAKGDPRGCPASRPPPALPPAAAVGPTLSALGPPPASLQLVPSSQALPAAADLLRRAGASDHHETRRNPARAHKRTHNRPPASPCSRKSPSWRRRRTNTPAHTLRTGLGCRASAPLQAVFRAAVGRVDGAVGWLHW